MERPSFENVDIEHEKSDLLLPSQRLSMGYRQRIERLEETLILNPRSLVLFSILMFVVCNILLILLLHSSLSITPDPTLAVYSPANSEVEYITKQFNRSRGNDKSEFQGWPTDEIDSRWSAAWLPGIYSSISKETAAKIPHKTARLPLQGRMDEYMVTLDVFHVMHCLDVVRQSLYRDRYDKHFYFPNGTIDYCKWLHVDHCLDQVRQSIMCSADISVVHYEWSDVVQGMRPRVDNVHTCRNYGKILGWAKDNAIGVEGWHPSQHVVENNGELVIEHGRNHAQGDMGECNAI